MHAGQFEQEREELLRAVDRCAVHQDEAHRLEWENRKRADEVKELQKVGLGLQELSLPQLRSTVVQAAGNYPAASG